MRPAAENGMRPLKLYWLIAALAGLGLLFWLDGNEPKTPVSVEPSLVVSSAPSSSAPVTDTVDLRLASREWPMADSSSPFGAISWYVPPPPPPPPAPLPPPEAPKPPPLPFKYLGTITLADGGVTHQVMAGEKLLALKSGMRIEGQYEFVGVQGQNLVFMYLPMQAKQTLATSGGME